MKRIAILGGGISGLTAAYELELARRAGADLDWRLYEATDRLGGIVETTRLSTPEGEYILEGGPDGWVSEKPWARDLAIELGLEADLIPSNDATRKTYILQSGELQAIPDGLRMMVPTDLGALEASPLFSAAAKAAYAAEPARAAELTASAPVHDESVATFVRRHFGDEVLTTLAAPLLSGVFGGDVARLSVRSVMPAFVAMEREHGSLILALQAKARDRAGKPPQPIFTSLRNGMGSLIDALVATLPAERLRLNERVTDIGAENRWYVVADKNNRLLAGRVDHILLATPLDATSNLLRLAGDHSLRQCLPTEASSAILATFTWPRELASTFTIPPGFGFLIPPGNDNAQLLAATFVDGKFPHRAPTGARILRAFFGGASADALTTASDEAVATAALTQLRTILGPIPNPTHSVIRRWPRSLPQYEVGHLDRLAQLESFVATVPGLHLLGNSYQGVGLPDLIHAARTTAKSLIPNP
jgi:oxygen-dependent protoporphyrinogen oxidase